MRFVAVPLVAHLLVWVFALTEEGKEGTKQSRGSCRVQAHCPAQPLLIPDLPVPGTGEARTYLCNQAALGFQRPVTISREEGPRRRMLYSSLLYLLATGSAGGRRRSTTWPCHREQKLPYRWREATCAGHPASWGRCGWSTRRSQSTWGQQTVPLRRTDKAQQHLGRPLARTRCSRIDEGTDTARLIQENDILFITWCHCLRAVGERLTRVKMVNVMQLTGLSLLQYTKIPLDLCLDSMLKLLLAHSPFYTSCLNQLGLATRKAYHAVCIFLQGNRSIRVPLNPKGLLIVYHCLSSSPSHIMR